MARKKVVELPAIVDVSLADSDRNYDSNVTFLEKDFRVLRIGADGDVGRAEEMIKEWMPGTAVFAITGARDARTVGILAGDEKAALRRLESATGEVPTTNGHRLRDVLQEWTVRKIQADQPGLFSNARTVVLGGSNHRRTARVLSEYTDNIKFADAVLQFGLPSMLDSFSALDRFVGVSSWFLNRVPDQISTTGDRARTAVQPIAVACGGARGGRPGRHLRRTHDVRPRGAGGQDADHVRGVRGAPRGAAHKLGVDLVLDDTPQPFEASR